MFNINKSLCTTLSIITVLCLVFLGNICFAEDSHADIPAMPSDNEVKSHDIPAPSKASKSPKASRSSGVPKKEVTKQKIKEKSDVQPNKIEKKFNDWTFVEQEIKIPVSESSDGTPAHEKSLVVYYISNNVKTKEGLRIIQTDIGYFDGNSNNLKLSQILPFGIDVQSKISFEGEDEIASGKVLTCLSDGCKWIKEISSDDLSKISRAKKLKTRLNVIGGAQSQEVTLDIPSKGFKKALAAMKKAASKTSSRKKKK